MAKNGDRRLNDGATPPSFPPPDDGDPDRPTETELDRIRRIADKAPFAVYVYDLVSRRNVYANIRVLDIIGYTERELLEKGDRLLAELIHPEDLPGAVEHHMRLAADADDAIFDHEFRVNHPEKGWIWCHGREVVFERDPSGKATHLLGTVYDVTDRKKLEAELQESEALNRITLENISDAVYLTDEAGKILFVCPNIDRIFGYSPEEIHAMGNIRVLLGEAACEPDLLAEGDEISNREFDIVDKHGNRHFLLVNIKRVAIRNATRLYTCRDITDRKQMESALIRSKNHAEAASKAKSDFLANVSHEIRTPISGIIGVTNVTLKGKLDGRCRKNLELIRNSADSLLRLINDILDFSKIEAGKLSFDYRVFDPRAMLEDVQRFFQVSTQEKGLRLHVKVDPSVPRCIYGDQSRLVQVINNLVGNAVKFTSQGSIHIGVSVSERTSVVRRLVFSVRDTGIGISADKIPELFHSFYQLDSSYAKEYPGTGLGLAISRKLVEMMGGIICVKSREGEGATFLFTITFEEARPADLHRAETPAKPATARPPALGPLKILLAEDERLNRFHMVIDLEDSGHRVVTAEDGVEALSALERERFDLILMDVQMPRMDGVEATRRIRSGAAPGVDRDIPIVALTAYAMAGDREKFLAAGMDDYIAKPVDKEQLDRVLETVLAGKPSAASP